MDENGINLKNINVVPQYTELIGRDNYIIQNKSDTGSMQVLFGDINSQYFKSTNKSIQISSSLFFLSSSGELYIQGLNSSSIQYFISPDEPNESSGSNGDI